MIGYRSLMKMKTVKNIYTRNAIEDSRVDPADRGAKEPVLRV